MAFGCSQDDSRFVDKNRRLMEIFEDLIKFEVSVKLALEIFLLGSGLILMGLGRRTDERLTAVANLDPSQALMQVAQKGRIGFGYPQVGAIAVTLWACLVLFGKNITATGEAASVEIGFSTILGLITVLTSIAMLQSRFTLDAVIWLLAVMVLGSMTMMASRDGVYLIAIFHLLVVTIGWASSTVSSLALWGVTPLNRMVRPLIGEQIIMAMMTAFLGVIVCEVIVSHRGWNMPVGAVFLTRAGLVLMTLGGWATIAQGIFTRSLLGMILMVQGTLFIVWSVPGLGRLELLGITFGIDLAAGLLLWWTYQSEFGNRETQDLALERQRLLQVFTQTLTDADQFGSGRSEREATDGFAVAGR